MTRCVRFRKSYLGIYIHILPFTFEDSEVVSFGKLRMAFDKLRGNPVPVCLESSSDKGLYELHTLFFTCKVPTSPTHEEFEGNLTNID